MFRSFFPDEYLDSAYVIDYEKLYREGYRGLLFDIDNTIVPHGAPADERARKLFEKLRGIGFRYCFVSNNQKPRVEPFAKAVEGNFIENAHKPAVKNYKKACQVIQTEPDRTIFVGDQLFTDILRSEAGGDPYDSCKTDSSKRGNSDCAETLSGKNSTIFLPKRGGEEFMNHIVIIGFMGSGKTRVGKRLAKDLGLPFIDVDRLIVKKMNMSVKEVFERFGEPFYRALETMAVKELSTDGERKVISVSAGLPLQEQNQKYLQNMGTIIYLKGSAATLIKRLEGSNNPTLEGAENKEDKIKKLLKQRDPVYEKFADIKVVTGVKPFDELIAEIEEKLKA